MRRRKEEEKKKKRRRRRRIFIKSRKRIYLDEPGPPLHFELLAEAVYEPLIAEEVASHVDVAVVEQNARLLGGGHQHLVELDHGAEFAIVTATHLVAAKRPIRQMRRDVQS